MAGKATPRALAGLEIREVSVPAIVRVPVAIPHAAPEEDACDHALTMLRSGLPLYLAGTEVRVDVLLPYQGAVCDEPEDVVEEDPDMEGDGI